MRSLAFALLLLSGCASSAAGEDLPETRFCPPSEGSAEVRARPSWQLASADLSEGSVWEDEFSEAVAISEVDLFGETKARAQVSASYDADPLFLGPCGPGFSGTFVGRIVVLRGWLPASVRILGSTDVP